MPSPPGAGLYSRVVPSRPCPVLKGDLVRSPSFLYALFSILAGCQPAAADRDSSPAAPAPTTAKTLERAVPEAVTPEVSVHNIVYVCEDGRRLAARYDGERAFLSLGERTLTLVLHPAASGARYIGEGMQWWTRAWIRPDWRPCLQGSPIRMLRQAYSVGRCGLPFRPSTEPKRADFSNSI